MLTVNNLFASIANVEILKSVSLHVREGEVVALIGANGAGKSTLLNCIAGLLPAAGGSLEFDDRDIARMPAVKAVRLGISLVPEGRQLFSPLSVIDNLVLGAYSRYGREPKAEIEDRMESVFELFPILRDRRHQLAGTLSGGEQQMLAIGRSLMSKPRLLLLDEPSIGLAPKIVAEIFSTILSLRERGMTLLLVEQNARLALKTADRAYVLETGQIVMEGDADELARDKEIERAYMGQGGIWD